MGATRKPTEAKKPTVAKAKTTEPKAKPAEPKAKPTEGWRVRVVIHPIHVSLYHVYRCVSAMYRYKMLYRDLRLCPHAAAARIRCIGTDDA